MAGGMAWPGPGRVLGGVLLAGGCAGVSGVDGSCGVVGFEGVVGSVGGVTVPSPPGAVGGAATAKAGLVSAPVPQATPDASVSVGGTRSWLFEI